MADQRNISIQIPRYLLDQIQRRSEVYGRSRNAEFRYLLNMALELSPDEDIEIKLREKEDPVDTVARVDYATERALLDRCQLYQRPMRWELVRLVAYAIQVRTDRDLKLVEEMMSLQGRAADGTLLPVPHAPQPSEPA